LPDLLDPDDQGVPIAVPISYEIIRLFSEGLYQSPHKAIEELVSNSFDAGADSVRVLVPRPPEDAGGYNDSLWVIDDGVGMDHSGFELLWRVADSPKADVTEGPRKRRPIGQFGIGKLAAYVLAWRLTHVSKQGGKFRYTSMDFKKVSGIHQWQPNAEPVHVALHEIDVEAAKSLLDEVRVRSPATWEMMFGDKAAESWTAAALSDFKDLFGKFREGTLGWVLRTGLPLLSDFHIYLNDDPLVSPREEIEPLATFEVGGPDDKEAIELGIAASATGITIPGIEGEITGTARIYKNPLTTGKAALRSRSNGFFVRVRKRVINLDDELFGLPAFNHATWARFSMDIDADGLRSLLLSSREGVRTSAPVELLREYLHLKLNACRTIYEKHVADELKGIDIQQLLSSAPSGLIIDPLIEAVADDVRAAERGLYYIETPKGLEAGEQDKWIESFQADVREHPFASIQNAAEGAYENLARYDADTRSLQINDEHPYLSKIWHHSKSRAPITMVATGEIVSDALLKAAGVDAATRLAFFEQRDRVLRVIAGEQEPDPLQALRRLAVANVDETAYERAVGEAFSVLGFEYEPRGNNRGGTDGVLTARLGRQPSGMADYTLVYDGKTTNSSSVAADKVDIAALQDFGKQEKAEHAFVIAKAFDGQGSATTALSRRLADQDTSKGRPSVTALTTDDLQRIIKLHYRHGVTLSRLRELFSTSKTVMESKKWVDELERDLAKRSSQVPLKLLLEGLERAKADRKSVPNLHAVRAVDARLKDFEPEQLIASLSAVQTIVGDRWITVDPKSGDVRLNHTANQILVEVNRRFTDELDLEPLEDDASE
jgi:hypothetical protein